MGQVLHGSASTTQAVRRAIQHSQESIRALARRHGINPKTVAKWRRRTSTSDAPMGPKTPRSTGLSQGEEAIVVAFRKHTLLPLDDCLYALQATIPHLTRSACTDACSAMASRGCQRSKAISRRRRSSRPIRSASSLNLLDHSKERILTWLTTIRPRTTASLAPLWCARRATVGSSKKSSQTHTVCWRTSRKAWVGSTAA